MMRRISGQRGGGACRRPPPRSKGLAGVAPSSTSRRASLAGTLAIADVEDRATGEVITVASIYASWEEPVAEAKSSWIYADAAVHRLISDLSALIGRQQAPAMIVAGGLNLLRGYGEDGSAYWARRYSKVFDRMEAIGVPYLGPEHPNGAQASRWPMELPPESTTVPTFRPRRSDPASAARQLDFVFASAAVRPRLTVTALNRPGEWGSSDHCRVVIALR